MTRRIRLFEIETNSFQHPGQQQARLHLLFI